MNCDNFHFIASLEDIEKPSQAKTLKTFIDYIEPKLHLIQNKGKSNI